MLPQERNRVTLADETGPIRTADRRASTYSWCDNDKRLIDHSLDFMTPGAARRSAHARSGSRTTTPAI